MDDRDSRWEEADEETGQVAPPAASSPPVQHVLRLIGDGHSDRIVRLEPGESVAGRGNDCHLPLADAGVSRVHAVFSVSGAAVQLSDLGSRNGTYVNGALVTEKVRLQPEDVLTLGGLRFRYAVESSEQACPEGGLYDVAVRDPLTGAYNRRFFEDRLPAEVAYAERHSAALSLLLFDVDSLNELNDMHGRAVSAVALKTVARTLARGVRVEDLVARHEGERFVILARGAELEGALALAERLRRQVEVTPVVPANPKIRVTVSAGAATLSRRIANARQLLAAVDFALLEAKHQGRNRVAGSTGLNDIARTVEMAPVISEKQPATPEGGSSQTHGRSSD